VNNIHAMNHLLRSVKKSEELRKHYTEQVGEDADPNLLYYCSGAANFVVNYLTGDKKLYLRANAAGANPKHLLAGQRLLNGTTAAELLKPIKASGGPYFGYLISNPLAAQGTGHECVFARTADQRAFYQANYSSPSESFTLALELNANKREWNWPDMSEAQFDEFFVGLTDPQWGRKLFPYKTPPVEWKLTVMGFNGANLYP
jgi:hypothetical protein